jgi:hypothetical protein
MYDSRRSRASTRCQGATIIAGIAILAFALSLTGCATQGQGGALIGGGIGALAGQAIGRDTQSTLIGAAVGTGIGYMIGNEKDKKHAKEMTQASKAPGYTHKEVGKLGGTRWQVTSLVPKNRVPLYASKIIDFRPNGRVITTTTKLDGSVEVFNESYRVVGKALIVNKPGYLLNAEFGIAGEQLIIVGEDFRAVLQRLHS